MSLVKSPVMTPAKIAANQANALKSSGPVTIEGKEHSRLNNFQHGLYILSPRAVLAALGENPDEFDSYEEALLDQWPPSDPFQERLVRRIARNSWRVERARHVQECTMARELEKLEIDRAVKAENHRRHIEGILAALNELAEMNRQGDFSPGEAVMAAYDRAFGAKPGARGKDIFDLMFRLSPALQTGSGEVKPDQAAAPPPPERARTSIRLGELLELAMREVREYDETYRLQNIAITPAERASMMGPVQAHATAMIRQEESLARQVERDVRLLLELRNGRSGAARKAPTEPRAGGGELPVSLTENAI